MAAESAHARFAQNPAYRQPLHFFIKITHFMTDSKPIRNTAFQGAGYTETRPWGSFTVLDEANNYKVKRIVVAPQQALSLQYHHQRAERWVVAAGQAVVTVDGQVLKLTVGESVFIPIGAKHRLENTHTEPLVLIELQIGSYLGEDDIVRLEDRYQRS